MTHYLDYNATAPYADSVLQWLKSEELPYANPASTHSAGRISRQLIQKTSRFLLDSFQLEKTHDIFYHSGASEGINTIFKALAQHATLDRGKFAHFFYSPIDHACVIEVVSELSGQGHKSSSFSLNPEGEWDQKSFWSQWDEQGEKLAGALPVVNWTYAHNETGVLWLLEDLRIFKEKWGAFLHVDAVQTLGRVATPTALPPEIDAYSFSGHKFGALKGIGFSFIRKDFPFRPLIAGGGQQKGRRSGTENPLGVYSLYLALNELKEKFNPQELKMAKEWLEVSLENYFGPKVKIMCKGAKNRNLNTISLLFREHRSDVIQAACDLKNIYVSMGSACSSGSSKPSKVLEHLQVDKNCLSNLIRLSFSPYLNRDKAQVIYKDLTTALAPFVNNM